MILCAPLLGLLLAACDGGPPITDAGSDPPVVSQPQEPPPSSSGPAPDANDRILLDTRQTLQQATKLADVDCVLKSKPLSDCAGKSVSPVIWSGTSHDLSLDVDGRGTNALRMDFYKADSCVDRGMYHRVDFPSPSPHAVYIQWKQLLGRTPTGGGIGALNSFDITNENCGNAGRKELLVLRDLPDQGGQNRIDYLWQGAAPVNVTLGFQGLNKGISWDPQNDVGRVVTQTLYMQAESAPGAKDGVLRLWVNGVLLLEYTGIETGPEAFHRFQFPSTFRAPIQDQTEYWWDMVAWEPK